MTAQNSFEIRLELAQGHWDIGEYDEALLCLERALEDASGDPQDPRLAELASQLANGLTHQAGDSAGANLRGRLERVVSAASEVESHSGSIASSTLAELLEQQGHPQKALQVAVEVLSKNPGDSRARAVRTRLRERTPRPRLLAELERWLSNLERRRLIQGSVQT